LVDGYAVSLCCIGGMWEGVGMFEYPPGVEGGGVRGGYPIFKPPRGKKSTSYRVIVDTQKA